MPQAKIKALRPGHQTYLSVRGTFRDKFMAKIKEELRDKVNNN